MKHLKNLELLRLLVQTIENLISNQHLFIEPYLHQLMPTLLTCIIGKRLYENTFDDHWELREEASRIVCSICFKYGDLYPTLQPRIMKTVVKPLLSESCGLATLYGTIVCLSVLGNPAVEMFLLPNVKKCYEMIQHASPLSDSEESTTSVEFEKKKCFEVLRVSFLTLTQ
jgi:transcription initiation factor TFIID subunit 6